MNLVAALFLTGVGATCVFAGYRLFCDLPALSEPRPRGNGTSVLLTNVVPGLLLAVLGTALVTTEVRDMFAPGHTIRHHEPAAHGASWHPVSPAIVHRSA
jgi:hypothetical protein